jgi:thiol-disulfide isomerase/thioredoxin
MKNLIYLFLSVILISSCSKKAENEYLIKGKISGKVPAKVYLQQYEDGEMLNIDSANYTNGTFELKGTISSPDYYYIQVGNEKDKIGLFVENSEITVTAHIDSLKNAVISGSNIQNIYDEYKEAKSGFTKQLNALYAEYKNAQTDAEKADIERRYDSIDNQQNEFVKQYVMSHGNSVITPFIINRELLYYIDLPELEKLTSSISPELKDNKYTQKLYDRISLLRSLQPGNLAPEFAQNDTVGNLVKLSDFRGRYVLIDFWASWCVPCRKANPTVVEMYKKYSTKGFTVLGVSLDNNKQRWLQAIKADGLLWTQVSSLESWKNPVAKLYGVNSIPHAVLIDPDGKIVKSGIHADELDGILQELLK